MQDLIATWLNTWIRDRHPIKVERNKQGLDVCYMKFGNDWYAIGVGRDVATWQWNNMTQYHRNGIVQW